MGVSDVVKPLMKDLEVYMIYMVVAIGSFLVFFGSSRRRYNSAFLRFLIMVAFNSSFPIITLIVGQMVSAPVTTQVLYYPCWIYFLLLFHGISDGISAQSLEDNDQWNRYVLTLYAGLFGVIGAFVVRSKLPPLTLIQTAGMVVASTYKVVDKTEALRKGSKNGVALDTKSVADFMAGNDQTSYLNYVVNVQEKRSYKDTRPRIDIDSEKVITVGKVWSCGGPDSKVKDLCLSFSMYNLLRCRFSGYSFPQFVRDRQLEFVQGVLLHGDVGAGENYRRPFRLIEQELGFLYDCFYTNYAYLFQKYYQARFLYVCKVFATILWQLSFLVPPTKDDKLKESTHNDILVTWIIIGVFMSLEFLQFLFLVLSNWGKLFCLCKYVGQPSWRSRKLRALFVKACAAFHHPNFGEGSLASIASYSRFIKVLGALKRIIFGHTLEIQVKGMPRAISWHCLHKFRGRF